MEKLGLRTAAKPLGSPIFLENALFLLKKYEIAAFVVVDKSGYFYGGEEGIRTLDTLMGYTRFPIVRARPTTRLLRVAQELRMFNRQLAYYNSCCD